MFQTQYPSRLIHDKIYELLKQGKRMDRRRPLEFRKVNISVNLIEKASASALVSMGGTKILVGIKVDVGTPYPDNPNQATLTVSAELLPLAYKTFEPGPPDENAIELARVVDRCIRESKAIELENEVLCYIPGQRVASIYLDVYVLDYDGNYFDPAVLASVAALATAKIPRYEVQNGVVKKAGDDQVSIPMRKFPVSVTMGVLNDKFLVDPTAFEESALDTSIVVGWGDEDEVAAIQKNRPGTIPIQALEELLEISRKCSIELRSQLLESLKTYAASAE
ncbi:MAG: exosome complex protein Rrp42 [Aigarchaeota archaeon]|nr:exosome complex protein Rrp42 [Aigarchaeota archaeon]MDW8092427.1 exosome complex protein Rrp42 [Nitrososphaerota archaeon]